MIIYNHGGYILYTVITFKGLSTKNRSLHLALTRTGNYICSKLTIETLEQGVKHVQS